MANTFYTNTVQQHLNKLIEERDYYLASMKADNISNKTKEGYRLMADFYDALITTAECHIEENS